MIRSIYDKKPILIFFYFTIVALVVMFGAYTFLSSTVRFNDMTIRYASSSIGLLSAFFIAKHYYPLKIVTRLNFLFTIKHLFPFWIISFILAGFPYSIWLGKITTVPEEYNVYTSAGNFEKTIFLLSFCIAGPFIEEIIFRGYVYRFFKKEYNIWFSVIVTIVLFNIAHGVSNLFSFKLAIISLTAIYSYEESGSIMSSIVYHMLYNTTWIFLVFFGMFFKGAGV